MELLDEYIFRNSDKLGLKPGTSMADLGRTDKLKVIGAALRDTSALIGLMSWEDNRAAQDGVNALRALALDTRIPGLNSFIVSAKTVALEITVTALELPEKAVTEGLVFGGMDRARAENVAAVTVMIGSFATGAGGGVWASAKTYAANKLKRGLRGMAARGGLKLTDRQASNLARFNRKLPRASSGTHVDELGDGVMFTAEVPGRVPGSKAVYQKAVDADGVTTSFFKTTLDPEGDIVHIKDKLLGGN